MTLIMAGGAEEQHTSPAALLLGPWGTVAQTVISLGNPDPYTGTGAFLFKGLAAGSSGQSSQTAKGWWSYAALMIAWDKGTHRSMWGLGDDGSATVRLGWTKGSGVNEFKVRLITRTGTYDSAGEFTIEEWHRVKVEFDNGVWTIWASDNGAAFAEVISQDDSGTYTDLDPMNMDVNSTTDETGQAALWIRGDDLCFWDPTGDNWNSRIGAQDFPRISEAHMPDTAGAKTESDAGQAAEIDEIPPTTVDAETLANPNISTTAGSPGTLTHIGQTWGVDVWAGYAVQCNGESMVIANNTATVLTGGDWSGDPGDGLGYYLITALDAATIDGPNYWTDVEDFKDVANGGSIPNDAVIQAVMVARADWATVWNGQLSKFNVREGGALSADSKEGRVQQGSSTTSSCVTYAGYYPWTPGEVNWTQAVFEACQYGCSLVKLETDQLTVQAIFFGSAHEWEPPAAGSVLKISTVAWASVKKVSSIAEASIKKVSTIAANMVGWIP